LTPLAVTGYSTAMNRRHLAAVACAASALAAFAAGAEGLGAERYGRSANGLETIVCQDEATPVEYVHIVFKAGAESLDADAAGSLSLLERIVLRDLRGTPAGSSGRLDWEGYATAESLGFRVAVPASALRDALACLASTLKSPRIDAAELDAEKEAAISAIRASASDPDAIYEAALSRRLFSKYPWRRDPAGSEKSVGAATAESLSRLAAAWLAPGDAAIAFGGPADAEDVISEVASLFADWKDAPEGRRAAPAHPRPGVSRPTWLVYPDPSMPEGIFSVELRYRGPDAGREGASSLAADLWSALVGNPGGRFASGVLKGVPKPAPGNGPSASHVIAREGGTISVSALFQVDPSSPAADRAREFKERVRGYELTDMRSDPSYCSPAEYAAAKARLYARRDADSSDARSLADSAAFWWSVGFPDHCRAPPAYEALGPKDMASFIDAYVMKNLEVVAIRMNPADYSRERPSLSGAGFEAIGAANAFWWPK
jgi:zinc protease